MMLSEKVKNTWCLLSLQSYTAAITDWLIFAL